MASWDKERIVSYKIVNCGYIRSKAFESVYWGEMNFRYLLFSVNLGHLWESIFYNYTRLTLVYKIYTVDIKIK